MLRTTHKLSYPSYTLMMDLALPMFKCDADEIDVLIQCRTKSMIKMGERILAPCLCDRIHQQIKYRGVCLAVADGLLDKISLSVGHTTLLVWLSNLYGELKIEDILEQWNLDVSWMSNHPLDKRSGSKILRDVWIEKLIEFNSGV